MQKNLNLFNSLSVLIRNDEALRAWPIARTGPEKCVNAVAVVVEVNN